MHDEAVQRSRAGRGRVWARLPSGRSRAPNPRLLGSEPAAAARRRRAAARRRSVRARPRSMGSTSSLDRELIVLVARLGTELGRGWPSGIQPGSFSTAAQASAPRGWMCSSIHSTSIASRTSKRRAAARSLFVARSSGCRTKPNSSDRAARERSGTRNRRPIRTACALGHACSTKARWNRLALAFPGEIEAASHVRPQHRAATASANRSSRS